ncbi:hypothetical protein IEQ34_013512 [Dendrobium chrysotoxum]|uniref:Ubiquitin-like protease family profile domain-containing protein n=1 Tax=Dendrobium chrysotoxum TaxID=161865 RepID=A0AAV7GQ39_DENCH|nr:hypothetical protein IEQ34_013512 [Dendrobium chrysotoxum]
MKKKYLERLEKPKLNQEVISMDKIEVLPRFADIKMEYPVKDFLTKEQQTFMNDCFKKFNKNLLALFIYFTCALHDSIIFKSDNIVYKGYKQPSEIFIQHINPDYVKESNVIIQPIIFTNHWTLIIRRLKERVWKLFDFLPNPEHKKIYYEIKYLHEDKEGAFPSDITNWNL